MTVFCFVVSGKRLTHSLNQDIRADEAQRDWEGGQAREIQRWNDSLATAEQEVAAVRERLDDLRDLEDITEQKVIQKARLYEELEKKRSVPANLDLRPFVDNVLILQG